jgi:hypothetical protein
MQPIKNDQAVTQMAAKQATPSPQAAHSTLNLSSDRSRSEKTVKAADVATKDILSGSATSTTKTKGSSTSRLAAIQDGKDIRDLQVLAVRTSKAVEVQMESAQKQMNEIVNSYPPFLRGSEQRQQYLMSISSIRKQIEAMIVPPIKLDNPALDATSSNEAKQMWASLFQGVAIPALATNGSSEASDAQIRAVSSAVGAIRSELSGRRAALELQLVSPTRISSPTAEYMSQVAGLELTRTSLSITTNLTGALKVF